MKSWIFLLMLLFLGVIFAWATTYHTLTIDGTNDFAADEDFTTSTGGFTAYFTWDAGNLYIGYSAFDVGSGESSTKWMVWYFDTDPKFTPKSGNGTDDGIGFNTQDWTLPFYADYMLQIRTDEGFNQLNKWNGSSWVNAGATFGSGSGDIQIWDNDGSNYIEIRVPLSAIGNPARIYALSYFVNEQSFSESSYGSWPDNALDGGDGYKSAGNFSHWYGYRLVSGISPDAGSNFDQLIPVELTSFTATATASATVILNWSTASETENLGFHVYRSTAIDGTYTQISKNLIPGAGSSAQAHSYSYIDENVASGATYYYKLADVDFNGNMTFHGPVSVRVAKVPENFALLQNYPNPFNPRTTIRFDLPQAGRVQLTIYNSAGQLVRTLVNGELPAGAHSVVWDARETTGARVASGVYVYRLEAGDFAAQKKLLLMK